MYSSVSILKMKPKSIVRKTFQIMLIKFSSSS